MAARTLLIPALLDGHWPLLRWAFQSRDWDPVILEDGDDIEALGQRNVHNDLCVPFVCITGQVLSALKSGKYDPDRSAVLIAQAGDLCRGSCLIRLLRPVLDRAGFAQVPLLSLNVRGLERQAALPVGPGMVLRARAALFWGDALTALAARCRPREAVPGQTEELRRRWVDTLSHDLQRRRNLSGLGILRRMREMAADFSRLPTVDRPLKKIAVTGDIYTKNCHLGNRSLVSWLEGHGCEVGLGGMSWYVLYYIETHLDVWPLPVRLGGKLLGRWLGAIQKQMVAALGAAGAATLPPFSLLRAETKALVPRCAPGAGWLMATEMAGWAMTGWRKVLCVQSFGCLPGHICARGQYAAMMRKVPGLLVVGVDYDPSTGEGTIESRIRLLLDTETEPFPTPERQNGQTGEE